RRMRALEWVWSSVGVDWGSEEELGAIYRSGEAVRGFTSERERKNPLGKAQLFGISRPGQLVLVCGASGRFGDDVAHFGPLIEAVGAARWQSVAAARLGVRSRSSSWLGKLARELAEWAR